MRFSFLFLFVCFSFQLFAEEAKRPLINAVKEYSSLQATLEQMLKSKCPECDAYLEVKKPETNCNFNQLCSHPSVKKDEAILYRNEKGEEIINERYYGLRSDVRSCLREIHADEIKAKREALTQKLGTQHLQKMLAANKKLLQLMNKHNQGNALAKVSAEILNLSIEAGLNGEDLGWNSKGTPKENLLSLISAAEKKLKINLVPEIKNTLADIQYIKFNPSYAEEVEEMDRALFPEVVSSDPFYDWRKLTDVKSAGGDKALTANRKKLTEKSQQAYEVFQETREDILTYLESKKTKSNAIMIERAKEKVKTISFSPPRLTPTLEKHCRGPNAFYSADSHSLTLCPQMLNFPKMSLIETIAHEIAHSFDSCNLSQTLILKKGPTVAEEAPFEIELKMNGSGKNLSTVFYGTESDPKTTVIQGPMKYKDHPFSSTMSCLSNPKSVGAVGNNMGLIKNEAEVTLESLKRNSHGNEKNNSDIRYLNFMLQNSDDYFSHVEGCSFDSSGHKGLLKSQMQEAFSDKISAEIVAEKIKGKSRSDAEKMVLEIGLSYGNTCPNLAPTEMKLIEFAEGAGCKNFFANRTYSQKVLRAVSLIDPQFDEHPLTSLRLDRNLLAHPSIRKALKCQENKGVIYCE